MISIFAGLGQKEQIAPILGGFMESNFEIYILKLFWCVSKEKWEIFSYIFVGKSSEVFNWEI